MKRMLAFLLCWTMLLSQLVMLAEAAKMQDQSDIFYLEENGIHVEDGAEVIMDQTPLGKSEPTDRYSPSVPKFVPEALYNLGIEKREEAFVDEIAEEEPEDVTEPIDWTTYTATIKSDKVMMYAFPRSDAESVYLYNCGGLEVELYTTDSAVWYRYNEVSDVNNGAFEGYCYIYADDVILHDRVPKRGIVAKDETGFAAEIKGAPAITEAAVRKVDPSRAPTRTWIKDGGVRTLIASYDISVRNPDRSAWQPLEEPVEVFLTLPEVPEMGRWGSFYVEYLDAEGVKQTIVPTKYFLSNVISFETDYLTEVFIYALDYPEDTDIIFIDPEMPVQFSYLYDLHDMSDRPFTDVENVTFSDPEKIKVEWFYDTEAKRGDWLVTLLEQPAQAERFIVDFVDSVPESRADHYYSGKGDFPSTLAGGNHYWVDGSFTHTGNLAVGSGTVIITFGDYGGSGKTLTLDGYLGIGAGEVAKLTINNNTSSNSVFKRSTAHNDQLIYVKGDDADSKEAKLYVYGAASRKLIIDGADNQWAADPLLLLGSFGQACLENCYIRNADNSSTHNDSNGDADTRGYPGGGIYCGHQLYLGIDVQIYNNTARQGGGLYLASGALCNDWTGGENGSAVDNKPDFKNNKADVGVGNGGGIYLAGDSQYIAYMGYLSGNSASGSEGRGGGVCIGSTGKFNPISSFTVDSNSAKYGGGIYKGGTSTLAPSNGMDFVNNSASTDGGGLYLAGGTYKPSSGTEFKSNKANSGHGGGIYVQSGTITTAYELDVGTSGTNEGNTAKWGAGIYVVNGTFNGTGAIATRWNVASENGGGLMVEGGTLTISGSQPMWIGYNKASNGYGGGLNVCYKGKLNDTSTGTISIYGNTASGDVKAEKGCGGGVYLRDAEITTNGGFNVGAQDDGSTEKGNYANWGSGMCIWSGGAFTYSGRVIVQYNNKDGCTKGGGIYLYGGTITCSTSEQLDVCYNKANYGGGIYIGGSKKISDPAQSDDDRTKKSITFNGTGTGGIDVYENDGDTNGGGIMAENCTWTNATPLTVRNNRTPGNGGGININGWVNRVTFTSSKKLSVTYNTATGNGAGIWNNSDMTITADVNSNVENNTATGNGGGIYNNGGTLTFNSKYFVTTNTAQDGGGIYHNAGTIQLNIDISIRTNTAKGNGGGIYSKSTFNMTKGAYVGSWAVAADNLGNKAVNGAGIYLNGGTFSVDGTLSMGHNIASNQGGGIHIQDGTFHQKSGTLRLGAHTYSTSTAVAGNEANAGGGLCMTGGTFKCEGTLIMNGNKAKTGNGGGILAENATSVSITGTGNEIKNNTARAQGGAMRCFNTNTTVKNATIDNNTATDGHAGGLIVFRGDGADGTLTLENCDITNNKCLNSHGQGINGNTTEDDDRGAGIYAQAINVSITGGSITGNTTPYGVGGGIYFNSSGKDMSISNCTISNNKASDTNATLANKAGKGGGIYVVSAKSVSINGATISGNSVTRSGGGIYLEAGANAVSINNTTIGKSGAGNFAPEHGGGIFTLASVSITGGSIGYNEAGASKIGTVSTTGGNGGGICLETSGKTVTLNGTEMRNNVARRAGESTGHGGAVYVKNGGLKLQGAVKIHDNEAKGNGGGVYMDTATFTGEVANSATPQIYKNTALNAGGIFVSGTAAQSWSNLIVGHATEGNKATSGNGGGIYVDKISLTLASNVSVIGNSASSQGGGVFIIQNGATTVPTLTCTEATVSGNTAANGAGVYARYANVTLNSKANIDSNKATNGNGGGIYMENNYTLTMNGSTVQNNTASANGAGVFMATGTLLLTGTSSNIKGNKATGNGGGLYMQTGNIKMQMTTGADNDLILDGNSANYGGGVFFGQNGGTVKLGVTSDTYRGRLYAKKNSAARGAGVYINKCTVSDNLTSIGVEFKLENNTASGNGGGLYVHCDTNATTSLTLKATPYIYNNNATSGGGALLAAGATVAFNGGAVFHNNTAADQGGGIHTSLATLTLNGSIKVGNGEGKGNSAKTGGGIFINGGKVILNGATIQYNSATEAGGGVYINSVSTLETASGRSYIQNNEAGTNGGGIYNAGTIDFGVRCFISGNKSSGDGGGIYNTNTVTADDGFSMEMNTATNNGGAIYNQNSITVTGTLYVGSWTDVDNHGNSAKNGAGIYNATGTFTMNGMLRMGHNKATEFGGGMYIAGGTVNVNGVDSRIGTFGYDGKTVAGNEAKRGAGVYVKGGTLNVVGKSYIKANHASVYGGGIYMELGTVLLDAAVVDSNISDDNGCGICMNGGGTMTVTMQNGAAVTNNTANNSTGKTGGGGIWVGSGGTLKLNGSTTISGNKTKTGVGGGIYLPGGKVEVTGTNNVIQANSAATSGGGIYQSGGTIDNSGTLSVNSNTAPNGGGVYLTGGGTLTTSGELNIETNKGTEGGGVFLDNATLKTTGTAAVHIRANQGLDDDNNKASLHGAGIYAQEGTITIGSSANVDVYQNIGRFGPGIFFGYTGKTVTINGSGTGYLSVYANHDKINTAGATGSDGAGIWIETCTVNLQHKMLVTRQVYGYPAATDNGDSRGAIRIQRNGTNSNGILNICDKGILEIQNCQGGSWSGGITMNAFGELHVQSGGTLTITGCSTTANGGAIQNVGGKITNAGTMTIGGDTDALGNKAIGGHGGGIYMEGGSLDSTGLLVAKKNKAETNANGNAGHGGGIYMAGDATIVNIGGESVIARNTATGGDGGGIYMAAGTLNLSGSPDIDGNTAGKRGGGMCVVGGTITVASGATPEIGDSAEPNKAKWGGGMFVGNSGGTLALQISGKFYVRHNEASEFGGGILLEDATLNISGGQDTGIWIGYNKATKQGGGIAVNSNTKTATLNDTLTGTFNIYANEAGTYGGGIWMNGVLNTNGMRLIASDGGVKNTAQAGGGICNAGGTFTATGTVDVLNNEATAGPGGGIWQTNGSFSSTSKLNVQNNTATDQGGGIYVNAATAFSITGSGNTINSNTSGSDGGGIYINTANTVNISGARINGNSAAGNGGGIYTKGNVTVKSIYVGETNIGNTAKNGGGIYVESGTLSATGGGTNVGYNKATNNGGGVYVLNGTLEWKSDDAGAHGNWTVRNNRAENKGGGVFMENGTVTSGDTWQLNIHDNEANYGGGMYLGGKDSDTTTKKVVTFKSLVEGAGVSGLDIFNNTAERNGGGIMIEACTLTMGLPVDLSHNSATALDGNSYGYGGGIFLNAWGIGATCNINATLQIFGCSAKANGGGIYMAGGESYLTEAIIGTNVKVNVKKGCTNSLGDLENSAQNGGGIYVAAYAKLTNNGTLTVNENTATNQGGGIYATNATLTFGTVTVNGNTAGDDGGGIYVTSTATSLSGGSVSNNIAGNNGGGLFGTNSKLTLSGVTFDKNEAGATKAGTPSTVGGNGGGIFATTCGETLTLSAVTLSNNTAYRVNNANGHGGGICVENYNLTTTGATKVQGNTAQGNGGGIYIKNNKAEAMNTLNVGAGAVISGNRATTYGGGAAVYNCNTIVGTGVQVLDNHAGSHGGGIFQYREPTTESKKYAVPTATIKGSSSAKILIQGNTSGGQGGGLYVRGCHLYADYVELKTNTSGAMGGGLLIFGYATTNSVENLNLADMVCEFKNGYIYDNVSGSNAGGAYVEGYGKLTIHNTKVEANRTTGNGGGLLLSMKSFVPTITSCTVTLNQATGTGGGIRMYTMSDAPILTNTTVSYNKAGSHGGGIHISGANLYLNNTNIVKDNHAGTVVNVTRAASETGGDGGGIYFDGAGKTLTLEGTTISYNTANASGDTNGNGGGIYMDGGALTLSGTESVYIERNTATNNGGGIYMNAGSMTTNITKTDTVHYPYIRNNTATQNGGGIYINTGATMTTGGGRSVQITGNTATNGYGGGIYNAGEINFNMRGQVNGNTATNGNGGGIYNVGTVTAKDGVSLRQNTAGIYGGGIYMADGSFKATGDVYVGSWQSAEYDNGNKAIDGAGIYQVYGIIELEKLQMGHNIASGNGGGIYMAGGSMKFTGGTQNIGSFFYDKATVPGNQAVNGAGIYLAGGSLDVSGSDGVNIGDNVATNRGGGIYTMVDLTLGSAVKVGFDRTDNGTALKLGNYAVNGAGIYVEGRTLTLGGVQVMYNAASNDGGGIYMQGGVLNINGMSIGEVTENYAGSVKDSNGAIVESTPGGNGGGIYLGDTAQMTMNGGTLSGNYAKCDGSTRDHGLGGGLYVGLDAKATLKGGGTITGNYATASEGTNTNQTALGGGVYSRGEVTFSGNFTISNNHADRYGGGYYHARGKTTVSSGTVEIKENGAMFGAGLDISEGIFDVAATLRISANEATSDGGGICMDKMGTFQGSGTVEITANQARHGGGLVLLNYDNASGKNQFIPTGKVTITDNTATGNGGGIAIKSNAASTTQRIVTMKNATSLIARNTAGSNGGGIHMEDGTVTLTDVHVESNYATNGGGVYMISGALNLNGATISGHRSRTSGSTTTNMLNGGGICMSGGTATLDKKTVVTGNQVLRPSGTNSDGNGGGIYASSGTLKVLGGSEIYENTASFGGGVFTGATTTVTGSHIRENTALSSGGGIFVTGGTTTVNGASEIRENTANGGGGARITSGSLILDGASIMTQNTSTDDGGGISMKNGSVTVQGGSAILFNIAAGNGGGIYMDGESTMAVTVTGANSIVSNNISISNSSNSGGGGVYMKNGTFKLESGAKMEQNVSYADGGGLFIAGGTAEITGTTIDGNKAKRGGGAYVTGGELNLVGATVSNHSVNVDNTAISQGGGVYASGGTVTLSGGAVIEKNTAGMGGGLYTSDSAVLNLTDTAYIRSNKANTDGGGWYYAGGTVNLATTADKQVQISKNEATQQGGGIYATKALNLSGYLLIGGTKDEEKNTAKNGGGIYGANANVTLNGAVKVNYNEAANQGGGIRILNGNLTLDGGAEVSYNKAVGHGGGIYAISKTSGTTIYTVQILQATLKGNETNGYGGALMAYDVDVTLGAAGKLATIDGNTSGDREGGVNGYGGAISLEKYYAPSTKEWYRPDTGLPTLYVVNAEVKNNTAMGGGAFRIKDANVLMTGGSIHDNTAWRSGSLGGGGIYFLNQYTVDATALGKMNASVGLQPGVLTIEGGTITKNKAINAGGGICLGSYGELVMTKAAKSPVFGNTADVEGNDLYAVGDTTTVTIRDTMDGTAEEYWFADYALGNAKYPGKPTFPSDYMDAKGAYDHLGRYASNKTPITFARRSFGADYESTDPGATVASKKTLALTLGLEQKLFMNLTLEKKLKLGETAVEDTTFIFYVKGLDNADFLMPVMIHLKKGEIAGSVTIRDLPMGIYDVCEDESWSWRYAPTNVAYSDNGNGMAYVVDDGDDYVRIKGFTTAGQTCTVTFTNGLDISRCRWLTDAYYFLPTKLTRSITPREDDEDETE